MVVGGIQLALYLVYLNFIIYTQPHRAKPFALLLVDTVFYFYCKYLFYHLLFNYVDFTIDFTDFLNNYNELMCIPFLIGVRHYSTKRVGKLKSKVVAVKSKVSRIVSVVKPTTAKDYFLLSISSIKNSFTYLIKSFSKFRV